MTDQPLPVSAFQPWRPIVNAGTVVQYFLAAGCASTYVLYAIARRTIGDHDFVTSGNFDPKDLGSGLVIGLARVLHAPAAIGAIVGLWAGIPFALVTLAVIALGPRRQMGRRWILVSASACVLTAVVAAVGQLPPAAGIRHWILD